jgi:aminopeptidase N
MRPTLFWALLVLGASAQAQHLTSGGPLRPEQAIMDIRHYTLSLKVDIPGKRISGYTDIDLVLSQASPALVFDLLDSFQIHAATVNGQAEPYTYANNLVRVNAPAPFPAGQRLTVRVAYEGRPRIAPHPPWDDGFIWTTDSSGHPWVGITAEGTGGKSYFPCKDNPSDEPNEGVDMFISVPEDLVVAGPGLLQGVTRRDGWATYHWATHYTINNYSIIFNVGRYQLVQRSYTTVDGHVVPMEFYVLAIHAAKAPHLLDIFERTAREQEKYFGEYPWVKEKIGLVETPYLGMEHQTMNAYGNQFQYQKLGGQDYDELMHHEFGHEWWGNKITARDWADYWIHEGICTFGDALYIREYAGEQAYIDYFKRVYIGISNKQPIILGKDIDEESAYQSDIYGKGAFFMHTLRYVLGDSLFFPILKGFATDTNYSYDHLVVTDDVEKYFSTRSGVDLAPLFNLYLRTTDKIGFAVRKVDTHTYAIRVTNLPLQLPLDVITDTGRRRIRVSSQEVEVHSRVQPGIDPDKYYFAEVTYQ